MNNVNDLNRTAKPVNNVPQRNTNVRPSQQQISLSAVTNNDKSSNPVSINVTNGVSGIANVEPSNVNKPVVRINPNKVRNRHRSIGSDHQIQQADPSELIPKVEPVKSVTPKDIAMAQLDETVARKRNEFKNFIANAIEDDKLNRERVESGLESVGEEVQYMPNELFTPMTKDQAVVADTNSSMDNYNESSSYDEEDEFFDDEDDVEYNESTPAVAYAPDNMTISNAFEDNNDYSVSDHTYQEEDETTYSENDYTEEEPSYDDSEITTELEDVPADTNPVKDVNESKENDSDDFDISEDSIELKKPLLVNMEVSASTSDFDIDEADLDGVSTSDENTTEDDNLTDEQVLEISEASEKHLRSEILQKIIQSGKKINTAQFVVSNKVINIKDALKRSPKSVERTAVWPLTFAGRPFVARALKGPEVALLYDADELSNNGSSLNITQARIMFEHDASPYRPATLEAWAKTIPYADAENIFAALYCASMTGANYIPMACSKRSCQYAYLTDNIDINSMIKFSTDEAKARFEKIKNMEITPENTGTYDTVVSVINSSFAIGLRLPSIFTVLYEYNTLNTEFVNKYTAMVSIIQYIDYIYMINEDTQQLNPIGWKVYPGDHTKTFKSKIATYAKILKELDATDFSILLALINSMITKARETKDINYEIPASKCPKCGAEIPARPIDARGLVFMRQRLVELATSPIAK